MRIRYLTGALLGALLSWNACAAIDTYSFKTEEQEQQYRHLTEQLRCPKCQNNSIADSNAVIATDMRQKVYELMQEGYTQQQVIDYMVARYGNFVTYEPPVTPATVILWVGPLLFVLIGGAVVVMRARRRSSAGVQASPELNDAEKQRLQQLLDEKNRGQSS